MNESEDVRKDIGGGHAPSGVGGETATSPTGKSKKTKGRRLFVNSLISGGLLGWLGSIIYPVLTFLKPPPESDSNVSTVRAGVASDFPVDSGTIVQFGRTPVLLVRLETGEFRAYTATCTHLDCIVQYRNDLKHIWCACHNGHYDLTGRNLSGPPPLPLPLYAVNVVDDQIVISKPV